MSCLNIHTNAGIKLYIAPAANMPSANTKSAWEAVTGWVQVSDLTNLSARGNSREVVRYKLLDGIVCKVAGARDNGSFEFTCADQPSDAGQVMLDTAATETQPYPVKVVHADTSDTYDVATTEYAAGFIRSFGMAAVSDSDSVRERNAAIELGDWYLYVPRYDSTP